MVWQSPHPGPAGRSGRFPAASGRLASAPRTTSPSATTVTRPAATPRSWRIRLSPQRFAATASHRLDSGCEVQITGVLLQITGVLGQTTGVLAQLSGDLVQLSGVPAQLTGDLVQLSGDLAQIRGVLGRPTGGTTQPGSDLGRHGGELDQLGGNPVQITNGTSQLGGVLAQPGGDLDQFGGELGRHGGEPDRHGDYLAQSTCAPRDTGGEPFEIISGPARPSRGPARQGAQRCPKTRTVALPPSDWASYQNSIERMTRLPPERSMVRDEPPAGMTLRISTSWTKPSP